MRPQFGVLKTVVKGIFSLLGEAQASSMIHQLEQRKLREATAETFLGTMCLSDVKDWDELCMGYAQTGERAYLLQALQAAGSPLHGLESQLTPLLAVHVGLSEDDGKQRVKRLPFRRSQRRALLSKRWAVKLFEREAEDSEPYKITETDKVVFFNVNVHRSKVFSLKGDSPAYQALRPMPARRWLRDACCCGWWQRKEPDYIGRWRRTTRCLWTPTLSGGLRLFGRAFSENPRFL